jgi:hypothetical protein
MDAAEYKHLVLSLIFVKYISDTFQAKYADLTRRLADPDDEYFYGDAAPEDIAAELEDRDYYREANVFWVPEAALGGIALGGQAARHRQAHRRGAGADRDREHPAQGHPRQAIRPGAVAGWQAGKFGDLAFYAALLHNPAPTARDGRVR